VNRHHTGSGRRRMVPEDWGRNHAAVVATSRNAIVNLRRPSTTGWIPEDRITGVVPGEVYASNVTARIQAQINRSDNDAESAEETLTVPPYLVTVDYGLEPFDGDEVEVVTCTGDPMLVGRSFRVDHTVHGTERFERDLFCTLVDVPPPPSDD
jgi:hypothetical protein